MAYSSFSQPDILSRLLELTPTELDALDFGVVKMDTQGQILAYNRYEADLAAKNAQEVLGKNFFTQIAPCTNNFLIAAKYVEYPEKRDEVLDYVFTYRIKPTRVQLRLLVDPARSEQFLLVRNAA